MEGIFFVVTIAITVVFVYWSASQDSRPRGKPVTGIFAYREGREPPPPESQRQRAPVRSSRSARSGAQSTKRKDRPETRRTNSSPRG